MKKKDIIEITVTVDTNDADYLTKTSIITEEELKEIMPLIEAIKQFKPYKGKKYLSSVTRCKEMAGPHQWHHNYPCGEYSPRIDMGELTKEEIYPHIKPYTFELFEDFIEYGQLGFHTVTAISIQRNPQKEILL